MSIPETKTCSRCHEEKSADQFSIYTVRNSSGVYTYLRNFCKKCGASKVKIDRGNVFYVYEHWRPDKEACFYVGKGHAKRAWCMRGRNQHHRAIVSKLTSIGMSIDVRIVLSGISEETAFNLEIDRLALYPPEQMANKAPAGAGKSGWQLSQEAKDKISKITTGRKLSEEHKAKVGAFFRGKKLSAEHIAKMSAAQKGRRPSPQTIAAAVAVIKGRKMPQEAVEKMAASRRGKKLSPEHCAAISAGQKGRSMSEEQKVKLRLAWKSRPPITDETRRKLSESVRLVWAARKKVV